LSAGSSGLGSRSRGVRGYASRPAPACSGDRPRRLVVLDRPPRGHYRSFTPSPPPRAADTLPVFSVPQFASIPPSSSRFLSASRHRTLVMSRCPVVRSSCRLPSLLLPLTLNLPLARSAYPTSTTLTHPGSPPTVRPPRRRHPRVHHQRAQAHPRPRLQEE
jgi:hypothetical protein